MEVPNLILENTFLDWKKKDVDKETRSKLLKDYLKERNISQRELARELNINYSTLQEWINPRDYEVNKVKMIFPSREVIFSLANRINFLLSKNIPEDEKTLKELKSLKVKLDEIL